MMLDQYFYPILIVLLIAIFAMAIFSGKLWARIQVAEAKNAKAREKEMQRLKDVKYSLEVIARAVIDERCDPAEGCIRLSKLISRFALIDKKEESLSVLFEMYEKVADFKYLEARKKLTKQQAFDEDKKRIKIEDEYREPLKDASKNLLGLLEKINLEA